MRTNTVKVLLLLILVQKVRNNLQVKLQNLYIQSIVEMQITETF